jgi:hypothetical protein
MLYIRSTFNFSLDFATNFYNFCENLYLGKKDCLNTQRVHKLTINKGSFTYFSQNFSQITVYGNGIVSFGGTLESYYPIVDPVVNPVIVDDTFAFLLVPFYNVFSSETVFQENQTVEMEVAEFDDINELT